MAYLRVYQIFVINVVDLLCFDDFGFIEKFEGDIFSGFFTFSDLDFAETSFSKYSSDFIIFEFEFSDRLRLFFLHGN